jgi:hypothetical protein
MPELLFRRLRKDHVDSIADSAVSGRFSSRRGMQGNLPRAGLRLALSGIGAAVCTLAAVPAWVSLTLSGARPSAALLRRGRAWR